MNTGLRIVGLRELEAVLDRKRVLAAVSESLIAHTRRAVQLPPAGLLAFPESDGEVHLKSAHIAGHPNFVIKVASGFPHNEALGLPVNHGLVLLLDARTGLPVALLEDEGWLTAWRTAAATALAAATLAPSSVPAVGIVGAGLQAVLSIEWLPETLGPVPFILWARDPQKGQAGRDAHLGQEAPTASATMNYTGSFAITDPSEGWTTCLVAIQTSGNGYEAVIPPSVAALDPSYPASVDDRVQAPTTLRLQVQNLTNVYF
jgi:ornithine cyclodeaminase/alanine dehydrogenase-like protein (mu-crystallin family)